MNTEDINIEQAFDLIESISPSDNWDLIFEQKLQNARTLKSRNISKNTIAILVLVFINVGFVLNSFRTETAKQVVSRNDSFKTIANELLSSTN
jgi:hypothetical protein